MRTDLVTTNRPARKSVKKTENLYRLLGLDKHCSQEQITAAYRKKVRALHPDRGGDTTDFKKVQHAYEVLRDDTRRFQYDLDGFVASAASDPSLNGQAQELIHSFIEVFFTSIASAVYKGSQDKSNTPQKLLAMRTNDPLKVLSAKLTQDIKDFKKDIKGLRQVHKHLRQWRGSVRRVGSGHNAYKQVLDAQLQSCMSKIAVALKGLHTHQAAKKLLSNYKFTTDIESLHDRIFVLQEREKIKAAEAAAEQDKHVPGWLRPHLRTMYTQG